MLVRYTADIDIKEKGTPMKQTLKLRLAALALCLLTMVAMVGCADAGEDGIPENMQIATVEGASYRLFVPIGWNLMTDMGISGAYASSIAQNYAAVSVHEYDNAQNLTAKQYAEQIYMHSIAAVYPEGGLGAIATTDTTLGGAPACALEYTGTRGLVTYRTREVLCAYQGRIYVLTLCTQHDLFESYDEVYGLIKTNFKFDSTPYAADEPTNTVDTDAEAPDGMMLASNDDVAYRFYVPSTWTLDVSLPTSSAYVSESDRSNVNVTVYMPEATQMTAEEYWSQCEQQLRAVLDDYTLISTTPATLDTRPANTYVYTATIGGNLYRFAQTVASYRGMVYTITYTALDGTFDSHMDEYNAILAAFDFRGN